MTRFLVLYRSSTTAAQRMAEATPEQARAGMDMWLKWAATAKDAIVDLGGGTIEALEFLPMPGLS